MAGELTGIAEWRLHEVLGEGDRAAVYRATRADGGTMGGERALKVLHAAPAADPDEVARFEARIAIGRRLAGLGIVTVLDSGRAPDRRSGNDRPWALYEKVDGPSLDVLVARAGRRGLAPDAGAAVVRGVLEALAAAQRVSPTFVHGNLDLGSVLVDAGGDVRVTGFGAEGDPRSDLAAVRAIAIAAVAEWPEEIESWLSRLEPGEGAFLDPAEALHAFPDAALGDGALGRGVKKLARAGRRVGRERERTRERTAPHPATAPPDRPARDLSPAVRQAEAVVWLCGALLFAAFAIEVLRFGG